MKKRVLVMLLTVAMGISLLAGCGEGAKTETGAVAENAGAEVEISEENTEPEKVEVAEELTNKQEDKNEKLTAPGEWIASLNLTEITPIIWNPYTAEGIVISKEDVYTMKENDRLFIYSKQELDSILSEVNDVKIEGSAEVKPGGYIYILEVNSSKETEVIVKCSVDGEEDIKTFNVIRPDFVEEDTSNLPGEEWILTLDDEVECPTLIVWNDETGVKTFIENGQEYTWQEADELIIYTNSIYDIFGQIQSDLEFNVEVKSKCLKLDFDSLLLKDRNEIKFEMISMEGDKTEHSITLLKPLD